MFNNLILQSITSNWDRDALTDYRGATLKYKDVGHGIAEIHLLLEAANVKKGDKVALCGRNSSNWCVSYLAILSYGAVAVPILHDFKADNIQHIVNHSDAVFFFVEENIWENLDETTMPKLRAIVSIQQRRLLVCRSKKLKTCHADLAKSFNKRYPKGFKAAYLRFHNDNHEELAYISYTSGTTSFSKGVMVPYRSLESNIIFAQDHLHLSPGDNHVCFLPMAHAFGLLFSFLFEFTRGCHTFFLTRLPSPKVIFQAYAEVKPTLLIVVPLIVEKVVKKNVLPKLQTPTMRLALKVPGLRNILLKQVRDKLTALFGGNFVELVIGGASLNEEVETFLRDIHFPFTIGYGMTECGPLISYSPWRQFKPDSCGRPVDRMTVRILSNDPHNEAGEIVVKGDNLMMGYYKNEQSTRETIDTDGWLHTGDLGTQDAEGNITIRGRSKNMILGPSGQNIYPEEIEDKLNNLPLVAESVVVNREGKIVALVHPDYQEAQQSQLTNADIEKQMTANLKLINQQLPNYSQVSTIKIYAEEFEKTPKRSIKRYLYQ